MKRFSIHIVVGWMLMVWQMALHAQPFTFNTLAGYAGHRGDDGAGVNVRFQHPHALTLDAAGNLYVADTDNHTIRKMSPSGAVTTVAGLTGVSGALNGAGTAARFNKPQGVCVDLSGNVYVADTGNHTIRKIDANGMVSTIAGAAGIRGNANGSTSSARFDQPLGVAVSSGGVIYVADFGNGAIRRISGNVVDTLATVPGPQGVAVDAAGAVYVADYSSSTILKVVSGTASVLAGSGHQYSGTDGAALNARFYHPAAVAVAPSGDVYVADSFNHTIRRISAGQVSTVAGRTAISGSANGSGTNALFFRPQGIAVDADSNLYVADTENSTIRKITPNGSVTTSAGSVSSGLVDGLRGNARFALPISVAVGTDGDLYVADAQSGSVRRITPAGHVSTLAGVFNSPHGLAFDATGNLYVADAGDSAIRRITPNGTVSAFAGAPGFNGYVDGIGLNAEFYEPQGLAVDASRNLFVADTLNHVIRKISPAGNVSTIAGSPGDFGCLDGTNSVARFNRPTAIAVDVNGQLYVSDSFNHTIRRIVPTGTNWVTSTVAGYAGLPGAVDGTNNTARFYFPRSLVLHPAGDLFVVDSGNHTLRRITAVANNWVVTTVGGSTGVRGSRDGFGAAARFDSPTGIAVDSAGYLYIADSANNTIRLNRLVPPQLTTTQSGSGLVISWSVLSPGFVLEQSSVLPGVSWTELGVGTRAGDNYVFTNVSAGSAFFRLREE